MSRNEEDVYVDKISNVKGVYNFTKYLNTHIKETATTVYTVNL